MTEKSETDKEVLDEAYRRGVDYLMRYACAPGVFAAVMTPWVTKMILQLMTFGKLPQG